FAPQADGTKEEIISRTVDEMVMKAGAIHGMVAVAGHTAHTPALDFTTDEIEQLWSIKGSIVFIASMASYRPNKRHLNISSASPQPPYGASKAGIRDMIHALVMEWAQHNIRVDSVCPGLVESTMMHWVPQ
ncbi:NAD(P)-binding protein, partial [Zopfia rhizophila CBS 207.26]